MKIVLVPDSFKGTLSSIEVIRIMKAVIREYAPQATVVGLPMADGGEGTVDAFAYAFSGTKKTVTVHGPYREKVQATYCFVEKDTAVMEMASCAGLPLVKDHPDPSRTTTYGVGELMKNALRRGARKIILGIGGSATNDGGCGMAAALGVAFYDQRGRTFVPVGATLKDIAHIETFGLADRLCDSPVITMCDIDNPLYGPQGAAYVFARQKGADDAMIGQLDQGLRNLSAVIAADLGKDVSRLPGAGAAGGLGAGMAAFLNSRLQSGIDTMLDLSGFEELTADADLVITGEGKLDAQSLRGKVVSGVARRSRAVRTIAVVGCVEGDIAPVYELGIDAVYPTITDPKKIPSGPEAAGRNLVQTMINVIQQEKL